MYSSISIEGSNTFGQTFLKKLGEIFSFDLADDQHAEKDALDATQEEEREAEKTRLADEAERARVEKEDAEKEANEARDRETAANDDKSKI